MPPQKYSSTDKILTRLISVSDGVKRRQSLKGIENKRVREAFTLLSIGTATGRKEVYLEFLQQIQTVVGSYGVVLCAAALGVSAVYAMKVSFRRELGSKIKEKEDVLYHACLRRIEASPLQGSGHTTDGVTGWTSPYTGDGYELTWEDAKVVVHSNQIVGQVYLIDTYSEKMASFMIVPVSDDLTRLFAMQRSKI
ncbi:hypothetical protein BKA67DRAFT_527175 [Truncatella angustata]|uniref:Uncharacterized protein n=1 Tax=Truncatella angustata TaxID=152316 RepID=A0A9P8RLQ5_9PEZI|nr:uncharacterized protein BKA67DRAFT_527175 [Truncatella angustata]KAH6645645.1 hypothetical protein BKA67DRAFT_527175 [Truncatella angustata]